MHPVVMITGAARNTGLAAARRFAKEGYDVCITSRDAQSAEETAALIRAEHPESCCMGLPMDPSRVSEIRECFSKVRDKFGRLDAFVANAAHLGVGMSVFNTTEEDWDAVMNANARGSFFCAQEAVKLMEKTGGAIVFISSVHSHKCIPARVVYTASKGAINAAVRALAVEVGYLGIRVNAVIAGAIWTERWLEMSDTDTAARRARYPSGRESKPEDIAAAVWYLCSDQSPTVTGTELTVDSGIGVCLLPYDREWNRK